MINLKSRTEYSFRTAYGLIEKVLERKGYGICDRNGTWGHVQFAKAAKKKGIKPVFGVELAVVKNAQEKEKQTINWMSFLARTNKGLQEIYELTTLATEQFYYTPRIDYHNIMDLSDDVIIFSGAMPDIGLLPRKAPNIYIELSPVSGERMLKFANEKGYKVVATSDNFYPSPEDKYIYEIIASSNKDNRTTPMHLLDEWSWRDCLPWAPERALLETQIIYDECNAALPTAEMVHFRSDATLLELCISGAARRKCRLDSPDYAARLERELELIKQKKFEDYFYVIADMVNYAKEHMLVGPARGSSCGSLVCYLLGITDIDPVPYGLLFERFIDINREDLPDIDIDFQDDRRELVFSYLREKYGSDKVARLGTVMRYKAKSAIDDVSRELSIPTWEVKDLKEAMIERSSGDSRAQFCIMDTFQSLEVGKKTLEKYPELEAASHMEGHARQSGQHAAGVLVTAEPVYKYCSVDKKTGAAMIDKKDAEDLNMLKIDALGLRTLSVIQDTLDQIGWTRDELLNHTTDDKAAFEVLNKGRFSGIFQFEGFALQNITRQMPVRSLEDIAAITALARPGPLTSGGTSEYVKRHNGEKKIEYNHESLKEYLGSTNGILIYQEQVLQISRNIGRLSWEDTSTLRKAMSKSFGKEYFDQFKVRFIAGAKENGIEEKDSATIWDNMCTFGAWGFNKCLHGLTEVELPRALNDGRKKITIEELFNLNRKLKLFSLHEDGKVRTSRIANFYKNGKKECYKYSFEDGSYVICTKDHKFIINGDWKEIGSSKIEDNFLFSDKYVRPKWTSGGIDENWMKRKEFSKFSVPVGEEHPNFKIGRCHYFEQFRKRNLSNPCEDCGVKEERMEAHHNDFSRGTISPKDLSWLCPSCHKIRHDKKGRKTKGEVGKSTKELKLISIEYHGFDETYDLEIEETHNFVLSNGLITHNSHAVAYGLVSYWCCILKAHFPLQFAASCLRNSKDEDQVKTLIRELVREGFEYKVFDKELSEKNWSVKDGVLVGGLLNIKGCGEKMAEDIMKRRKAGIALTPRQEKLVNNPETPYDNIFEARNKFAHLYDNPSAHGITMDLTEIRDISDIEEKEYIVIGKLMTKNLRDLNEVINVQKRGGRILKTHTEMLNFSIGDDTGQLRCNIGRYDYERIGKPIVEEGKIGDWYIFRGVVRKGFMSLNVKKWRKL